MILLLKSSLLDRPNWQACLRLRGAKQTCCNGIQSNLALCLPCRAGSEPIYLQHTVTAAVMTLIRLLVGGANAMNADKPTSFLVIVADGQYKIFACCVLDHHRDFNNSITLSPGGSCQVQPHSPISRSAASKMARNSAWAASSSGSGSCSARILSNFARARWRTPGNGSPPLGGRGLVLSAVEG
jgi:hypothetical protein